MERLIKNSKNIKCKALFLILNCFLSLTSLEAQTVKTVRTVDLEKYAGKWFEVASFPQRFQKNCYATTAVYTSTEKGYMIVENRCKKGSLYGKQSYINGKAFVVENTGNAKLKIQFF